MAKLEIAGLTQLMETLRKFPDAVQARAAQVGMRKASSKLRTAMRRAAYAAPLAKGYKRTNQLRESIRAAVGKRPEYKGKAWVGLKKIAGAGGKVSKGTRVLSYYKTLEHGRKAYQRYAMTLYRYKRSTRTAMKRKRVGTKVAASPPLRPFWARGWAINRAAIERIMIDETLRAISIEAGKAYAKSKAGR